jgi:bifunctional DNA-binding transcriptional regulator/antitoxin component of YhaV-PrlF toxin-antitoxin module
MKSAKYSAKFLPDGHLPVPESVRKKLGLSPNSTVEVLLVKEDESIDKSKEFFDLWGSWKDNKSPEEIIDYIYGSRTTSKRETFL